MLLLMVRRRPLSTVAACCAVAVAVFETVQIVNGDLYLRALNSPDGTTLLMVCFLIGWGLVALRQRSDLEAVSFSFMAALSCLFAYEAIYKWSFYLAPFVSVLPPPELRELVLQIAVAMTVLTGFAVRLFSWNVGTWVGFCVFGGLWVLWMLVGFPQLDGRVVFRQVLPWDLDRGQVYLVNRATKLALFLLYATFFPALRLRDRG